MNWDKSNLLQDMVVFTLHPKFIHDLQLEIWVFLVLTQEHDDLEISYVSLEHYYVNGEKEHHEFLGNDVDDPPYEFSRFLVA